MTTDTRSVPWNDPHDEWNSETWGRSVSGIRFTQYLLPDGRRRSQWIDRPTDIEAMARELVARGCSFDIEILRTGDVSMTVQRESDDDEVLAHEICVNGPTIPASVDTLVREAHAALHADAEVPS
jgi:hypothetical protein